MCVRVYVLQYMALGEGFSFLKLTPVLTVDCDFSNSCFDCGLIKDQKTYIYGPITMD